ncbi:MAG: rimM [Rickettsiaceae bacterium]|jgi:16S rRNA processing protein RimM|nr:rimM [Rickettsiaceae bacterium]
MQKLQKLICVGQIASAHGIQGHIKLRSFTEPASKIFYYKTHYDENGNIIDLKQLRPDKEGFICYLKDINTRNLAESIKGKKIYVSRSDFESLQDDEFYVTDLEGAKVYAAESNEHVGNVIAVLNFGAGDLVEIELNNLEKIIIPFNKDFFLKIDLEQEIIYVNLPKYL